MLLWKVFWSAIKFKPDIFHAHLHEGAFIGLLLCKLFRTPLVFDLQGSLTDEIVDHKFTSPDKFQFKLLRKLEKWINNSVDAVIASSSKTAESVRENFKVPQGRIFSVIDGVNADIFKPDNNNTDLFKKYNLPRNKKIVLYLGLLDTYQGTDLLLDAIKILSDKTESFHAVIAGYPNVEMYRSRALSLGISNVVTFTGRIDYAKAPQLITVGDIAVSPKISLTEGNQKICNYMACELPVVVFDGPVNREILGDLGVYAKMEDPNSLAEGIQKLLDDEKLRKQLGRKSRERVRLHLSWEHSAGKILEVYNHLLKE